MKKFDFDGNQLKKGDWIKFQYSVDGELEVAQIQTIHPKLNPYQLNDIVTISFKGLFLERSSYYLQKITEEEAMLSILER